MFSALELKILVMALDSEAAILGIAEKRNFGVAKMVASVAVIKAKVLDLAVAVEREEAKASAIEVPAKDLKK